MAGAQLAAVGTAAAWRLGHWDLLKEYTPLAVGKSDLLSTDEMWEVRIGKVLLCVSNRQVSVLPVDWKYVLVQYPVTYRK